MAQRSVMTGISASRPFMPGYGVRGPDEGTGLLPWAWAEERLTSSRNFWLATVRSDGIPHLMPVWAVWDQDSLWFSSGYESRKARNLATNPSCTIATEDAANPVVVQGIAEPTADAEALSRMLAMENAKYGTEYGIETLDPKTSTVYRVRPRWVFGLASGDFTGSPTRWIVPDAGESVGPAADPSG